MDPREFMSVAQNLAQGRSPGDLRSAISRAYYAAFNVGREVLGRMESRWRHLEHGDLERYLKNSGHSEVKIAGDLLGQLRSLRRKADYYLTDPKPENQKVVALWMVQTTHIVDRLDQHCSGAAVATQLRNYARQVGDV